MTGTFVKWIFAILLVSTQAFAYVPHTPNNKWTPGSICNEENDDFTEYRYPEQIPYCTRNVSTQVKTLIYEKYKIPKKCRSRYTIDHLIPLSIGGDNSTNNLWPEHKLIKAQRPNLEMELYKAIRIGDISQTEAIQVILREKKNFKGPISGDTECDSRDFLQ